MNKKTFEIDGFPKMQWSINGTNAWLQNKNGKNKVSFAKVRKLNNVVSDKPCRKIYLEVTGNTNHAIYETVVLMSDTFEYEEDSQLEETIEKAIARAEEFIRNLNDSDMANFRCQWCELDSMNLQRNFDKKVRKENESRLAKRAS